MLTSSHIGQDSGTATVEGLGRTANVTGARFGSGKPTGATTFLEAESQKPEGQLPPNTH